MIQTLIPELRLLAVALQLVGQRRQQLLTGQPAKSGQGQLPALLQAQGALLQQGNQVSLGFGVLDAVEQALAELVALQAIEAEMLVVLGALVALVEPDLESLTVEVPNRIAQKTLQRGQLDGCLQHGRRQRLIGLLSRHFGMQRQPFAAVTEQAALTGKVIQAERLKGVISGQGRKQIALICRLPTGLQVITQLANQHRGWPLAVVADAASDPTDVQGLACRKHGFEQQITVVLAA